MLAETFAFVERFRFPNNNRRRRRGVSVPFVGVRRSTQWRWWFRCCRCHSQHRNQSIFINSGRCETLFFLLQSEIKMNGSDSLAAAAMKALREDIIQELFNKQNYRR